jgi:folate-binding protein YgfZ
MIMAGIDRAMEVSNFNGVEVVENYGDIQFQHAALWENVVVLDLSPRSRLCLAGTDRVRFLHGQVTNDVKVLRNGEGCYAALITAKGKMQSDMNIYCLPEELLLDFEPGLTATVSERLHKYVIADDVQIIDVASNYGLLSVQGPKAESVVRAVVIGDDLPAKPFRFVRKAETAFGEIHVMNQPRLGSSGYDLLVATEQVGALNKKLIAAAKSAGGCECGRAVFEIARIEGGIPRFGADMDETTNPLEAGLEERAISFNKGCYIGQEVISRIRTYSEVAKALRGLRLADDLKALPKKGDKLFHHGKDVGFITSATVSPRLKANIALGYVKREVNQPGTELTFRTAEGESHARIVEIPFVKS